MLIEKACFWLLCVKGAPPQAVMDCFLQPVSATPASVLRTLANPFHRSRGPPPLTQGRRIEPVSATPASVLRTLANPSNRCAVSEPVSATPARALRALANPFHHFVVPLPLHRGGIKLRTNSPITKVSFAYFSFQRKVGQRKVGKEKCGFFLIY